MYAHAPNLSGWGWSDDRNWYAVPVGVSSVYNTKVVGSGSKIQENDEEIGAVRGSPLSGLLRPCRSRYVSLFLCPENGQRRLPTLHSVLELQYTRTDDNLRCEGQDQWLGWFWCLA